MKGLIIVGVLILIIFLLIKSPDWADSENKVKQNIGCTVMALGIAFMILLNIVGFFKECSGHHDSGPSIDYYDAPRK